MMGKAMAPKDHPANNVVHPSGNRGLEDSTLSMFQLLTHLIQVHIRMIYDGSRIFTLRCNEERKHQVMHSVSRTSSRCKN